MRVLSFILLIWFIIFINFYVLNQTCIPWSWPNYGAGFKFASILLRNFAYIFIQNIVCSFFAMCLFGFGIG